MSRVEHPASRPLLLRPWIPWALGLLAVIQVWACVDNIIGHDWILAGCFGLATLASVIQLVVLLRLRRRA